MHYTNVLTNRGGTPQGDQARADQVRNNAGGFVFAVSPQTMLERFLILGTEQPTYYVGKDELTKNAVSALTAMIASDGVNVVKTIVAISEAGRAPKQDAGIFALALCAGQGDLETRRAALAAIPKVCRTGSTLLQFCAYIGQARGWGRGLRNALAAWYNEKDVERLAYQVTKYRDRNGWTHRDVFRKAHPTVPATPMSMRVSTDVDVPADLRRALYDFIMDRPNVEKIGAAPELKIVDAYLKARGENPDRIELAKVLSHEMVPSEWKKDPAVWDALLPNMPMTAMIRNLAAMTTNGFLAPRSNAAKHIVAQLGNAEKITKARVHPIAILTALSVYKMGRGIKGSNTWIPVPEVLEALDNAFYLAFGNVEPSGKRIYIGLDVSGSMGSASAAPGLNAREACAAMSMVQVATEKVVEVGGFTSGTGGGYDSSALRKLPFAPGQRLDDVIRYTNGLPFGRTDCALPMVHAREKGLAVDTFVIYTDNETWHGRIHPYQALNEYRKATGIPAKLVVAATAATGFSIADPNDAGMVDVVGFDASVPTLIADFSRA